MTFRTRVRPPQGTWASVFLIYFYGVLASASLSKIIPLLGDVGKHMGASPAQSAWLISLVGILPAGLAAVAGSIIDRIGAHRALQLVAAVGICVNAAYLLSTSLHAFMAVRVLEGLISVGAYSAAPALIMATTAGERRSRAMAVWSTYTPVGFSLGLVMSGAFAGSDNWRGGYLVHLVLFGVLLATSWLLPRIPVIVSQTAPRAAGLFAAWGQPGPLRLALTFGILVVMGFGMSSVYPQWYARQHELTPGQASSILALVNLAMIPAGFLAGSLLVRGWRDLTMLTVLLLVVMAVSVPLFMPDMFESVRLLAMVIWMLAQGALIAVVLAALPRVVADPRRGAGAAGLIAQLGALTTFITPMVWQPLLQRDLWMGFVAVIVAAAIAGWLLFPRHAAAQN